MVFKCLSIVLIIALTLAPIEGQTAVTKGPPPPPLDTITVVVVAPDTSSFCANGLGDGYPGLFWTGGTVTLAPDKINPTDQNLPFAKPQTQTFSGSNVNAAITVTFSDLFPPAPVLSTYQVSGSGTFIYSNCKTVINGRWTNAYVALAENYPTVSFGLNPDGPTSVALMPSSPQLIGYSAYLPDVIRTIQRLKYQLNIP